MSAEVEHGQGDEGFGWAEPERDPGDETDLGVDRLDAPVGQAMFDRGEDQVRCLTIRRCRSTNAGIRERRVQVIQTSRASSAWS